MFPKCKVSVKASLFMKIIHQLVEELNQFNSNYMFETIKFALLLYLSKGKVQSIPSIAMIENNDSMYISHECLLIGLKIIPNSLVAISNSYRNLAQDHVNHQLNTQMVNISEMLSDASMNDIQDETFNHIQQVYNQICYHFKKVSKQYLDVLSFHMYFRCVGILSSFILNKVLVSILGFTDISEKESQKLNLLMNITIVLVEDVFSQEFTGYDISLKSQDDLSSSNDQVNLYVDGFLRYKEITEILVISLKDITERYKKGWYIGISSTEIENIVKALFSSSVNRDRVLEMIQSGSH